MSECGCGWNPETGYLEACPKHEGEAKKTSDLAAYRSIPEIHAAVNAVANIAERFRGSQIAPDKARTELFDDLIRFFANFDRMRTDEVERLKSQQIDALQVERIGLMIEDEREHNPGTIGAKSRITASNYRQFHIQYEAEVKGEPSWRGIERPQSFGRWLSNKLAESQQREAELLSKQAEGRVVCLGGLLVIR